MSSFTPTCSCAGYGNAGAPNTYRSYGHLFRTNQPYTIAPFPTWRSTLDPAQPSGDYRSFPMASFHPLYVSNALGYYGPSGAWAQLDQR